MDFKSIAKKIMDSENLKSTLAKLQSFEEIYEFFTENGYDGSKQELKENLFGKSKTAYEIPEAELDQVGGGASGRKALAACAGIAMLLNTPTPLGINNEASAKIPFFDKIRSEISGKKTKTYDSKEIMNRVNSAIDKIAGQNDAKETMSRFFKDYVSQLEDAQHKKTLPGPQVLIFNGPSSRDKTYMAELLSEGITKIDPYVVNASDILKSSNGDSLNMPFAFFYGNTQNGRTSKNDSSAKNNLMTFLKSTEGSVRVVIVDEWDKIYKKDTNGVYPSTNPLDETLRDILNNGLTDYTGTPVDLDGAVFIFTTNETTSSLQGRIEVDSERKSLVEALVDENGNPVLDEQGEQVYGKPNAKSSQKQSIVPHDASLMEHLSGHIFYFNK